MTADTIVVHDGSQNRRTKLTPARHKAIAKALRDGGTVKDAAGMARVGRRTIYDWLKRGVEEWEAWDAGEMDTQSIYVTFTMDAYHALADRNITWLGQIQAGAKDWQRFAWLLERTDPESYALTEVRRHEITGADGGPVAIEDRSASLADVAKVLDQVGALAGLVGRPARAALPAAREVLPEPRSD